jgi:hypothetical protein
MQKQNQRIERAVGKREIEDFVAFPKKQRIIN